MPRSPTWGKAWLYGLAIVSGACIAQLTSVPAPPAAQAASRTRSAPSPDVAPALATAAPADERPGSGPTAHSVQPGGPNGNGAAWAGAREAVGFIPSTTGWTGLGEEFRRGKIITGATPHRLILFSFDDGPDRRSTPLLLDRLDAEGIRALFFLVGERLGDDTPRLRQQSRIAREIVRRGHLVGNHTVNHVQLPLLDDQAAMAEILGAEQAFESVFGARPWLIRPPFGAHSQRIDQHLGARDYTVVLWNLGAGDHQVRNAEDVFQTWLKVFQRRERDTGDRGGIILLHDTYAWSVDAFQQIVAHLLARNCELLGEGEELYDFVDDLSFFYVARGTAEADAEAPPATLPAPVLEARQARLRELTAQRCRSMPTTI